MASTTKIEVTGLKELNDALNKLSDDIEKKILRKATRKAAIIFRDAMRTLVPRNSRHSRKKTPHLQDDIKVRMKKAKPGSALAQIGPGKKTAWIANFLEFGTRPHIIKASKGKSLFIPGIGFTKSIKHPGAAAKPFVRPAFDGNTDKVIDSFKAELKKALEPYANKVK